MGVLEGRAKRVKVKMGREEGERGKKIRVIVLSCILPIQLLVTSN